MEIILYFSRPKVWGIFGFYGNNFVFSRPKVWGIFGFYGNNFVFSKLSKKTFI
jgi:hypothetical protein